MKIDLTKEEWEYLTIRFSWWIDVYQQQIKENCGKSIVLYDEEQERLVKELLKKLGSEWKDHA